MHVLHLVLRDSRPSYPAKLKADVLLLLVELSEHGFASGASFCQCPLLRCSTEVPSGRRKLPGTAPVSIVAVTVLGRPHHRGRRPAAGFRFFRNRAGRRRGSDAGTAICSAVGDLRIYWSSLVPRIGKGSHAHRAAEHGAGKEQHKGSEENDRPPRGCSRTSRAWRGLYLVPPRFGILDVGCWALGGMLSGRHTAVRSEAGERVCSGVR